MNNWPDTDGQRRPKGFVTPSKKKKNKSSETNCAYDLGPPACLYRAPFCNAIGFRKRCMITLQDSMGSTSSWQVRGLPYKNGGCQLGSGWKKVCQDTGLKYGDVITLKVIKTRLWDVIIMRS
ncbi:hypothetical protein SETIT_7G054300v2 [Setaria italica]|uniref:TF-B3 domain-containing protein n=1 Tax=Setaria italica TaxID=4555 RepID=A0A368RSH9_SETIT|nr:hypothetical protein SETIT_7G054300v2 [Setaria italica]